MLGGIIVRGIKECTKSKYVLTRVSDVQYNKA